VKPAGKFTNKKRGCLGGKINDLGTNKKKKNIRVMSEE
jgi:hypothetical protein